ncbi:hypothetical protein [Pseudomaricurvus sp. HS19]|uniref:hypothetical protein n=1 Tax=Pseudomaricurvus sp. HS19 TaxID=2692626 RepID=UPI00136F1B22|nr:hypothetical protein [Pseudomaricurvus sp. HS19]MYM65102.1 hypothetical protein [Pseudomaricurvus sp. HS19]
MLNRIFGEGGTQATPEKRDSELRELLASFLTEGTFSAPLVATASVVEIDRMTTEIKDAQVATN